MTNKLNNTKIVEKFLGNYWVESDQMGKVLVGSKEVAKETCQGMMAMKDTNVKFYPAKTPVEVTK